MTKMKIRTARKTTVSAAAAIKRDCVEQTLVARPRKADNNSEGCLGTCLQVNPAYLEETT